MGILLLGEEEEWHLVGTLEGAPNNPAENRLFPVPPMDVWAF